MPGGEPTAEIPQEKSETFDLKGGKSIGPIRYPNKPIDVSLSNQHFQIIKSDPNLFNCPFILIDKKTFNFIANIGYKGLWEGKEIIFGRNHPYRFPYMPDVSGEHLSIAIKDGDIIIKDLGSTNGSKVVVPITESINNPKIKDPSSSQAGSEKISQKKDEASEESILPISVDAFMKAFVEIASDPNGILTKTLSRTMAENPVFNTTISELEKTIPGSALEKLEFIRGAISAYLLLEKAAHEHGQKLPKISEDVIDVYLEDKLKHMKINISLGKKPEEDIPEDSIGGIKKQDPEFGKGIMTLAEFSLAPHTFISGAIYTHILIEHSLHAKSLEKIYGD